MSDMQFRVTILEQLYALRSTLGAAQSQIGALVQERDQVRAPPSRSSSREPARSRAPCRDSWLRLVKAKRSSKTQR